MRHGEITRLSTIFPLRVDLQNYVHDGDAMDTSFTSKYLVWHGRGLILKNTDQESDTLPLRSLAGAECKQNKKN